MTDYKLTITYQHSKRLKTGRSRSLWNFFLNGEKILTQKVPFDETWDFGYGNRTGLTNVYLLDGNLYQTRVKNEGCGCVPDIKDSREVRFPVSKSLLTKFNIPKGTKITI